MAPKYPFSFDSAVFADASAASYAVVSLVCEAASMYLDPVEDAEIVALLEGLSEHIRVRGSAHKYPAYPKLRRRIDSQSNLVVSMWGDLKNDDPRKTSLFFRSHFLDYFRGISWDSRLPDLGYVIPGDVGSMFRPFRDQLVNTLSFLRSLEVADPHLGHLNPAARDSVPLRVQNEKLARTPWTLQVPLEGDIRRARPEWAVEWDRVADCSPHVTLRGLTDAYRRCTKARGSWKDPLQRWVFVQDSTFMGPAADRG